jgi:uridine phosphorylase
MSNRQIWSVVVVNNMKLYALEHQVDSDAFFSPLRCQRSDWYTGMIFRWQYMRTSAIVMGSRTLIHAHWSLGSPTDLKRAMTIRAQQMPHADHLQS